MSLRDICDFVEDVHILTVEKGAPPFRGPNKDLPLNGLYVFFETGQKMTIKSKEYDRIVRIGINEKPNNFRSRIRGHYGGNIEGSVFRANVGWALLEFRGERPRETYRTKKNYKKHNSGGALESEISDYFCKAFTYKAFSIDYDKLGICEELMIAAFSIFYQWKIFRNELDTSNWLGKYSYSGGDKIRRSGLWNSEGVVLINESSPSGGAQIDRANISLSKLNVLLEDLNQNVV
jgi:hypothetical protein